MLFFIKTSYFNASVAREKSKTRSAAIAIAVGRRNTARAATDKTLVIRARIGSVLLGSES
jgi:hypothetical protein